MTDQLPLPFVFDSHMFFSEPLIGTERVSAPLLESYDIERTATYLSGWASQHSIPALAAAVKKLFLQLAQKERSQQAARLLRAFGYAFQTKELGVLGYDILQSSFRYDKPIRKAAYDVLAYWLSEHEDQEGLALANARIDAEEDQTLKESLISLLDEIHLNNPSPEAQERINLIRSLPYRVQATVSPQALSHLLEHLIEIPTSFTLDILESLQIGDLVAQNPDYKIQMSARAAAMRQIRAWSTKKRQVFSVETTPKSDTFLLSIRF